MASGGNPSNGFGTCIYPAPGQQICSIPPGYPGPGAQGGGGGIQGGVGGARGGTSVIRTNGGLQSPPASPEIAPGSPSLTINLTGCGAAAAPENDVAVQAYHHGARQSGLPYQSLQAAHVAYPTVHYIPQSPLMASPLLAQQHLYAPGLSIQQFPAAVAGIPAPPIVGPVIQHPLAAEAANAAAYSAQAAGANTPAVVPECKPEHTSGSCLWPWIILVALLIVLGLLVARYFSQHHHHHNMPHVHNPFSGKGQEVQTRTTSVTAEPGSDSGAAAAAAGTSPLGGFAVPWASWFSDSAGPGVPSRRMSTRTLYLD